MVLSSFGETQERMQMTYHRADGCRGVFVTAVERVVGEGDFPRRDAPCSQRRGLAVAQRFSFHRAVAYFSARSASMRARSSAVHSPAASSQPVDRTSSPATARATA